jgi:exonuclease III
VDDSGSSFPSCFNNKEYGAAQEHEKNNFLCELSSFCHKSKHPRLLGGDFDIIRRDEEKNTPGVNKWSSLFNAIIDHNSLIELNLVDRLYTWSNNRDDPTFEKLDRFLVSPEWDLTYHDTCVRGLNRTFSDHVPLCLSSDTRIYNKRDFKYELCWKHRPDFGQIVKECRSKPVGVNP